MSNDIIPNPDHDRRPLEINATYELSLDDDMPCFVSLIQVPAGQLDHNGLSEVMHLIAAAAELSGKNRIALVVDLSRVTELSHNFRSITDLLFKIQRSIEGNKLDSICFVAPQELGATRDKFFTFYRKDLINSPLTSTYTALKYKGKPNVFESIAHVQAFFASRVTNRGSDEYRDFLENGFTTSSN